MTPPSLPSVQDFVNLELYGNQKGQFPSLLALVFREQYGGRQGQIGIQVQLALEMYGGRQGQSLGPS